MGDDATAKQSYSFSRLSRLRSPAEYRRVFERPKRSGDRFFTVLWRPNELAAARIGFAIAKKRVSLAVGRNRIRRVARESFRHQRGTLAGVDIVLLANSAADTATKKQLQQSLERHWDNIRNATGDQVHLSGRRDQRSRDEQQ